MALGVEWVAAEPARRTAPGHDQRAVPGQREHLRGRGPQPDPLALALLVLVHRFFDLQQEQVALLLVSDRQATGPPPRLDGLLGSGRALDESVLAGLEEVLFTADIGVKTATALLEHETLTAADVRAVSHEVQ